MADLSQAELKLGNLPADDPNFQPTPAPDSATKPVPVLIKKDVSKPKPGAKDSKTYIASSPLLVRIKKSKLKQEGGSIKTKRKKRRKSKKRKSKKRTKRRKSKKRVRHKRR